MPENGRWKGYSQLLLVRMKELWREPEVIFWVFTFPVILAAGLGIAFRNKPADVSRVVVVESPGAAHAMELLKASPVADSIHAERLPAADAFNQFRLGKYDLVVTPQSGGGFEFRYDPARPESTMARTEVDDALQVASGRKNTLPTSS